MDQALDTIEYLARSDHRIEVLEAIRNAPRTREEIRTLTDASRVTAGRIITDLEEHGWIVRNGSAYEPTVKGEFVAREFTRLLNNLNAFEVLPSVVEWVPGDEPTFDLCLLDGATVITADEGDLIGPIRRGLQLIEKADPLTAIANGASREFTAAMREAVEGGATQTLLVPPNAVEALRANADLRADVYAMLRTGRATLLRYDGDSELPVMQVGAGTVALCSGDHRSMVETDHPRVMDWAESYITSLRSEATPVPAETFDGDSPVAADRPFVE